jgi:hypothetical protein
MTRAITMEEQAPPTATQLATQHLVLSLPLLERTKSGAPTPLEQPNPAELFQKADSARLRPVRVHSAFSRASMTLAWGFCNIALLLSNRCVSIVYSTLLLQSYAGLQRLLSKCRTSRSLGNCFTAG